MIAAKNKNDAKKPLFSTGLPLIGLIGGLVVLIVGLLTGVGLAAGIGFLAMAVSFIFLNFALARRAGGCKFSLNSIRRFTSMTK